MKKGAQAPKRRHLFSRSLFKRRTFDAKCVKFWLENSPRSCCMHREKHFYFKMLITFEPNVAQRSVASQNDHKSKACLPEASNTAFTMYSRSGTWLPSECDYLQKNSSLWRLSMNNRHKCQHSAVDFAANYHP